MKHTAIRLLLATSLFILSSSAYSSTIVTVDSTNYEITTFAGFAFQLDTQSMLMDQVWWGDEDLALAFAEALGGDLGFPNVVFDDWGPYFATDINLGFSAVFIARCNDENVCLNTSDSSGGLRTYAKASEVSVVPIPAAAWLFGSALLGLVGYSRRKAKA